MIPQNIRHLKSQSVDGNEIELCISVPQPNTIEIVILNINFTTYQNSELKKILLSSLLLAGCFLAFQYQFLNIVLLFCVLLRFYCYICLVEFEKLTVAEDFGVQLVTKYALGRKSSLFIQFSHIEDIVISEVIHNLKATFMLSFLTKGECYKKKPIIPIMNVINPRLDVIKIVYNVMRNFLKK